MCKYECVRERGGASEKERESEREGNNIKGWRRSIRCRERRLGGTRDVTLTLKNWRDEGNA